MPELRVPPGFLLGAATSAYQIEGAWRADGKGPSIWDDFCRRGRIADRATGETACDHYHRWAEDLDLLAGLGANAYRFSISWPRIFPDGQGAPNPAGADFYARLTDGLLARGLAPLATLYHWDLPSALQARGGWAHRDTAERFADYAAWIARRLGDRVALWATLNEPATVVWHGYLTGRHAPGLRAPRAAAAAAHHLLLGHGLAASALRAARPRARVGVCLNFHPVYDLRRGRCLDSGLWHGLVNRWFADPLFHGAYPAPWHGLLRRLHPAVRAGDFARIRGPLDFLGVNYYTRLRVRGSRPPAAWRLAPPPPGAETTAMGWEVFPQGLTDLLAWLRRAYGDPVLYLTENGAACEDAVTGGGVSDGGRVRYLHAHLERVLEAAAANPNLRGYFVWSLLDNFEWDFGYRRRFGLVYVDYATQVRTPKTSARWFARLCAERRLPRPGDPV